MKRLFQLVVPSVRTVIDVSGGPHRSRKHGGTLVHYSGRAALKREKCYMWAEGPNSEARRDGHSYVTVW
jgi:hypothetical protein